MNYKGESIPVMLLENMQEEKLYRVLYFDTPLVIYKSNEAVYAFKDICPHRGMALSQGRLTKTGIECSYHGWQFDHAGSNGIVPVKNDKVNCSLLSFYTRVRTGIVWVSPAEENFSDDSIDKPCILLSGTIQASVQNALENFLDGSHTHFVHNKLVRSNAPPRQKIFALLTQNVNGFTVNYALEPSKGLLTRLLPAKFKDLTPVARYIYPFTAILEYYTKNQVKVAGFEAQLIPEGDRLRYFASIYLNPSLSNIVFKLIAKVLFKRIISQDKALLEKQAKNLQFFSDQKFYSDETDRVGIELFSWLKSQKGTAAGDIAFDVWW